MKVQLHDLAEQYKSALQDYLNGAGEGALQHAYEVGRRAITRGLGVLEMMAIHEEVVRTVLFGTLNSEDRARIIKAAEFFAESLSPFEMTHRGFQEANVKLRLLSEHLQSVREEERTRIARDVHDELGQALTCLKMDLSWLDARLFRDSLPQDGKSTGKINRRHSIQPILHSKKSSNRRGVLFRKTKSILKLIDKTIQTVRRISTDLRPAVLDDLGLAAAIEWQVREFQARTRMRCRLILPSQGITLDQERMTAIFRIFQEALTNVARHSNATRVKISLKEKVDHLILEVQDNGCGITESEISDVTSLGLLGMRERAIFWGGEVNITGSRGKGTAVSVRIPIHKAGDN